MPLERVADLSDPRLADYRVVAEPELARSRGVFVAEGRLVVRRLIEDGRCRLRSVLVGRAALRSLETILAPLADRLPIFICEAEDFVGITGYDIHRGCLALAERPRAIALGEAIETAATTVVVLEGVTNADNVGGVFRNAAAFGASAVLLSPTCCDPLYRKAIRTSMAATLRVPFAQVEEWPEGLAALRTAGFMLVALTPRLPALTLGELAAARPPRVALLVGTEGAGLTAQAERLADCRVRIPIAPEVDSLNLAVAVGIALHRLNDR